MDPAPTRIEAHWTLHPAPGQTDSMTFLLNAALEDIAGADARAAFEVRLAA